MEKAAVINTKRRKARRKPKLTLESVILFCTGMFSTMPIVTLKFLGRRVSLFTVFFALSVILLLLCLISSSKRRKMGGNIKMFLLWLALAVCSSAVGWLYFKPYPAWQSATTFYLSKIALYFLFAVLWSKQKNSGKYAHYLLHGMLVGSVLNLCWSVIDAAGYYIFGVSVSNTVFRQYAIDTGTRYGTVSLITNGMIRASGFNDDPAHIGFLAPAVIAYALYKKKGALLLLGLISIFSSASTTALVGTCIVLLLNIRRLLKMMTVRRIIFLCVLLLVVLFMFLLMPQLRALLQTVKEKFFDRILNTYGDIRQGGERSVYLFGFFTALKIAGPMVLFGTGFGTASYAYVFDPGLLAQLGEAYYFPYDMEMTYIAYLFDLGIFGFALFMIMLYRLLSRIRCKNGEEGAILRALTVGMVLSMLFYHFTLMAMQVLITIVGLTYIDVSKQKRKVFADAHERLPLAAGERSYAK